MDIASIGGIAVAILGILAGMMIEGGNIGYAIRPSERRKGFGTLILRLTLEKAKNIGLTRVLVTCDADNVASRKIIERNGGVLAGQVVSEHTGKLVMRYFIDAPQP